MANKQTLSTILSRLLREQFEEEPKTAYFSAREKKPFSSDLLEKIIHDEIISGRVFDQSTLDALFESLDQSLHELRTIPFDIFVSSQQLQPK